MDQRPRQLALCEQSGFKCYADELVRAWDGAMVLPQFCDVRNSQDFVTGVKERVPSWSRPEVPDVFVGDILTGLSGLNALTSRDGVVLTSRGY